jgi:tetratricopeptide (TPR) repeat protein
MTEKSLKSKAPRTIDLTLDSLSEIEALGLLIRETDSGLIAFALVQGIANRELVVSILQERMSHPFVEIRLTSTEKNPVKFLNELSLKGRGCIFFYGLEDALPEVAGYLNLQREAFAEVSHAVVFWVSEYGLRAIAIKAPDFFAWRSGVFDLRIREAPATMAAMMAVMVDPLIFRDRQDLEKRLALYQELFQEYSQQEKPDDRFLSNLQNRMGFAFYYLGRFQEAEECTRKALELSQASGDRSTEAIALSLLGRLAVETFRFGEAEKIFRQQLGVEEELGDQDGIAKAFHNLGNLAVYRREFNESEEWYRKALEINRRLGLEREIANTYYQLGSIAQEREKLGEAEAWYQKALEIRERLDLERETADTYLKLGTIAQEREKLDEAEAYYEKALEIYERLGHPPLLVNTMAQLGLIYQGKNNPEQAVMLLGTALAIAVKYKMRDIMGIIIDLARLMKAMGEEHFTQTWRQHFEGQEPPLEIIREFLDKDAQKES